MSDRATQTQRVLAMLEEGPQTTASFLQACMPRYSARILELRKAGHSIATRRLSRGSFEYTLQASESPSSPMGRDSDSAKDGGHPPVAPTPAAGGDLDAPTLWDPYDLEAA